MRIYNNIYNGILTIILMTMSCIVFGQRDRSQLSTAFKTYLTENNLWEQWEEFGEQFTCPQKNPKPVVSLTEAKQELEGRVPEEEMITVEHVTSHGHITPFQRVSASTSALCILSKGEQYRQAHSENPTFFEDNYLTVLKTFDNFPDSLRNRQKFIVLDITASMGAYAEQVLLWQAMGLAEDGEKKYVFFNDGDDKSTYDKSIGSTGGLYLARGETPLDLENITREMTKGMKNGGGGDIPENDVEALVYAQTLMAEEDMLILVADASSPMRDLSLYTELNVPVHIVLCGFVAKGKIPIHYAALAALTGGTIHSMEEDIWDIEQQLNGKQVFIDGLPYLIEQKELKPIGRAVIPND